MKIHIARHHNRGEPIKIENEKSTSRTLNQPDQRHYPKKPSFHTTEAGARDDFTGSVILDNALPTLRKLVEFNDLRKELSPQQPFTIDNAFPWLAILSLPNFNGFQRRNNPEHTELPAGFRVRICNNCLSGNRLEPVFACSIEYEALTKIKHACRISSVQEMENNTNNIREGQEMLLSILKKVVSLRINQQRVAVQTPLRLMGLEFGGPMALTVPWKQKTA